VTVPPYLQPFVLSVPVLLGERHDHLDIYPPDATEPRPAIVFVHGGPVPAELRPTPREWPVFQGYGSLAVARGAVGVTLDHRLHSLADYPVSAGQIAATVETVRADPRVDADRIALWFFSGGGLLMADWLRNPPPWLRCVAASYPVLAPLPGWIVDPAFRPAEAVAEAGDLPIVLTTVGRERPEIAATVDVFLVAARSCGARLTVIEVPNGQHSFDMLDHTDESRAAVEAAFDAVLDATTK
jgi:acetyl esterase/lipase